MRAILIAPDLAEQNLLVQELEHTGKLQDIYASLDCNLIDCIRLDDRGNVMYVDDEGYLNKNTFFLFGQYPMPLAGRGLIVGSTPDGESASTDIDVQMIRNIVAPCTPAQAYRIAKTEDQNAMQRIKDMGEESFHIYVRVSEIMEGAWYSNQLELDT